MDVTMILVFAIACGGLGALIDGGRGAVIGALLGPLGVLIAAVLCVSGDKK